MARNNKNEEKEPLIKRNKNEEKEPLIKGTPSPNNFQNHSGALYTDTEGDTDCDDEPETIRPTTGVRGETFPSGRLSSVSSQSGYSDYSGSNLTSNSSGFLDESITNGGSKWRFWSNITTFTVSSFLGGLAVSILVPFYTKEAEEKGVTVSQAGLVYGSVNFVQILFIPIFGKYLNKLGALRLFLCGLLVAGAANVLFGFLQWIDHMQTFLALSFVIRIVSAIGEAAFLTSLYPLATKTTSEKYRATILSVIETSFGIGLTTGPALGGILYDFKGFYFPFVIVGGIMVFCSIVAAFIIDKDSNVEEEQGESFVENGRLGVKPVDTTYCRLFMQAAITIPFIILIVSEMSIAWFLPTLEPFLSDNFNLNSTMSGILFSLEGLTYAAFSPLWGILLDRGVSPYFTMILGVVCQIVGLSLLGPARYLEFIPKSPYTTGIGLFILGSGIAASFIVTLTFMLAEASKADKNILDTEQTRGMITSLWLIAENIGGWLGSTLGGIAYDNLGFEGGSLVIIGLQSIIVVGIPYVWCRTVRNRKKRLQEMFSNKASVCENSQETTKRNINVTIIQDADENTPLLTKM